MEFPLILNTKTERLLFKIGYSMAKVLITGAAGFVGCNLSNWLMLHSQHQLVGIDNMTTFSKLTNLEPVRHSKRYSFYVADVRDEHIMERILRIEQPNYIIHAAGSSDYTGSFNAIAQAVKRHPVERLLVLNFIDQRGAIADSPRDFDDEDLLGVRRGLEEAVVRFHSDGVNTVAANFCDLYGPREAPIAFVPGITRGLLEGKEINPGDFDVGISEWMYIKDAFLAICALMKYSQVGHIYNITAGYRASKREMLYKIAGIIGVDLPRLNWGAPEYEPIFNEDRGRLVSTQTLGWKPVHGFEESLEHTVCWYNANRWAFKQEMER